MLKVFSGAAGLRLAGACAQVLMTLTVARVAGPRDAGIFFFGFSALIIGSTACRLGTELSGLRAIARSLNDDDLETAATTANSRIALVGMCSGLVAALLVFAAPLITTAAFDGAGLTSFRMAALSIPALALIGLVSEFFKAADRQLLAISFQNVYVPLGTAAGAGAAAFKGSLSAANCSTVLAAVAWACAIAITLLWRRELLARGSKASIRTSVSAQVWASSFKEAPSLLTVALTSVVMQWIGSLLLGFFATAESVAGYAVAVRLSIAVSVIHSAATSVVAPKLAIAHGGRDVARLRVLCHQTALMIASISLPILFALLIFAPQAMAIFGSELREYATVLRVLIAGQVVASLIGHSGTVLVMGGHYRSATATSLFSAASLALLSVLLIPLYGVTGAGVAMASAVALGHLAGLLFVRHDEGVWTVPASGAEFAAALSRLPSRS